MAKKITIFFFAYVVLLFFLFAVSPISAQILTASPTNQGGVDLGAPIGGTTTPSSFADYVNRIYQFAVVIGISLAVLMIIFAGYKYMSSAGDPQSLAEAKEVLVGAIVGLVLILLTRLILASIDPRLLQFPNRAPELANSSAAINPGVGSKGDDIEKQTIDLCKREKAKNRSDWQKGPCLTKSLGSTGFAVDLMHNPPEDADNIIDNTCGIGAKIKKMIILDLDCNFLSRKEE